MKVCAAEDSCEKVQTPPSVTASEDGNWFFHALVFTQLLLFVLIFTCGYFSGRSWNGSKLPTPPPATSEAASQKDEAIVPQRLRAQLAKERQRSAEFAAAAAREARQAIDLNVQERDSLYGERQHLFSLLRSAEDILKRLEREVNDHMDSCPQNKPLMASKVKRTRWNDDGCQSVRQIPGRNLLTLRRCSFCGDSRSPLDFSNLRPDMIA